MDTLSENAKVSENWDRYEYGRQRGHIEYCEQSKKCENFYLGGGLQWSPDDIAELSGRPAIELNHIMPMVNGAIGHQIHNRMDISFMPRGGNLSDQDNSTLFSKVTKSIIDRERIHWKETQIYGDGMIQQRGFLDIRMDYNSNVFGDAKVTVLDPLDVQPDPDAKSYEPAGWSDVIVTRWMTLDEIEDLYGKAARDAAEAAGDDDQDHGDETSTEQRNKFASSGTGVWTAVFGTSRVRRIRIIDRQRWVLKSSLVAVYPTGEIRVAEGLSPQRLAAMRQYGCYFMQKRVRRVQWTVSTRTVLLFDKLSPYDRFTVVPYFPYFRRGKTRGMVDNAISPQEMVNKHASQFTHIINTTANSGYKVEQNSLTNMDTDDLENDGAKTGLVLEYAKGSTPPEKILPNPIPPGIDRVIERGVMEMKEISGMSDAMQGLNGPEVSGIAIQSKQFAGQQQLEVPLDNLKMTRHMVAEFLLYLIQNFYDSYRVFRITEQDPRTGKKVTVDYPVNVYDAMTGGYMNDLSVGEYDVVVADQPTSVTFENGQFQQALELRKSNVDIPDHVVVKHSNLADKAEILEQMQEQQGKPDPLTEAKVTLVNAQARETSVNAVNKAIEALFSATQAANMVAANPSIAPMADQMLKSAGFEDHDAAPIMPNAPENAQAVPMPTNTNPLTPANPAVGVNAGIEGGAN